MWGDVYLPSETNRSIIRGIVERMKETGNRLTIHAVRDWRNDAAVLEALTRKLHAHPCDGYILQSNLAPHFKKALGGSKSPIVYMWYGIEYPECEPMVRIDLAESVARAVSLLAAEGHRRIGLVGLTHETREEVRRAYNLILHGYETAMAGLGLTYRASAACTLEPEVNCRALREMFSRRDPPEAIYVADDILLRKLTPVLKSLGLIPGQNLAVITLACRGNPLPAGFDWSRMEFHPFQFGRLVMDCLLRDIESAGEELCSFSHQAAWRPGQTHRSKERN